MLTPMPHPCCQQHFTLGGYFEVTMCLEIGIFATVLVIDHMVYQTSAAAFKSDGYSFESLLASYFDKGSLHLGKGSM